MLQVPGDGERPGVQALPGQFLTQADDQLRSIRADRGRRRLRPPGPRLERHLALSPIPGHQPGYPALGHPVSPGHLPLRPALHDNRSNHQTRLRHPPTLAAQVFLCLETPHSDVLRLDTSERARPPSAPSSQALCPPGRGLSCCSGSHAGSHRSISAAEQRPAHRLRRRPAYYLPAGAGSGRVYRR